MSASAIFMSYQTSLTDIDEQCETRLSGQTASIFVSANDCFNFLKQTLADDEHLSEVYYNRDGRLVVSGWRVVSNSDGIFSETIYTMYTIHDVTRPTTSRITPHYARIRDIETVEEFKQLMFGF